MVKRKKIALLLTAMIIGNTLASTSVLAVEVETQNESIIEENEEEKTNISNETSKITPNAPVVSIVTSQEEYRAGEYISVSVTFNKPIATKNMRLDISGAIEAKDISPGAGDEYGATFSFYLNEVNNDGPINIIIKNIKGLNDGTVYGEYTKENICTITTAQDNVGPIGNVPNIVVEDTTINLRDSFDPLSIVTANDEEDGDITSKVIVKENTVDTLQAGEYKVVYEVTDSNGNVITKEIKVTVKSEEVVIPDKNLRREIEKVLGKSSGESISINDMEKLNYLDLIYTNSSVTDLSGLEYAKNLTSLQISNGNIVDLTPIRNLTNLTYIRIEKSNISSIEPLRNLVNLNTLWLSGAEIKDLSPLSGINNLQQLILENNNISDITPLNNLINLQSLSLSDNNISDITPLKNLTELEFLNLNGNNVSDITPLSNLANLYQVSISRNKILDLRPLANANINHIEAWSQIYELEQMTVKDQTTVSIKLPQVYNIDGSLAKISSINFYDGYNNNYLTSKDGYVDLVIDTLSNREGKLDIYFEGNNSTQFYGTISQTINIESTEENTNVIKDKNLEAHIKNSLNIPSDVPLTKSKLKELTHLYVDGLGVETLEGLQYAENLSYIGISNNNISDISALSELTKLIELRANDNSIEDISPLKNLVNLKHLELSNNLIEEISALNNLVNLNTLYLWNNKILDVSPISGLNLQNTSFGQQNVELPTINIEDNTLYNYVIPKIVDNLGNQLNIESIRFNDGIKSRTYEVNNNNVLIPINTSGPSMGKIEFEFYSQGDFSGKVIQEINITSSKEPEEVVFPDYKVDQAVRDALDIDDRITITERDLKELESISLNFYNKEVDLSGLEYATNLTWINIDANKIENIGVLNSLYNLQSLSLSKADISELDFSKGFEQLRRLSIINNCIFDKNTINLKEVESLQYLWVSGLEEDKDLSFLSELNGLIELNLSGNDLSDNDITVLSKLSNLENLNLSSNNLINPDTISKIKNLNQLTIWGNKIRDIKFIEGLNQLEFLDLSNNEISDISILTDVSRYKRINLSNNRITDLSSIQKETINNNIIINNQEVILDKAPIKIGESFTFTPPVVLDVDGNNISRNGTVYLSIKDGWDKYSYEVSRGRAIIEEVPGYGSLVQEVKIYHDETPTAIEYSLTIHQELISNEKPIINGANDIKVKVGDTFNPMTGVTATDKEDGNLTSKIKVKSNTVDTTKIGSYKVVYEVTDSDGNTVVKERTVKVDLVGETDWKSHWAVNEIKSAMENGWVKSDNNFRPNDAITRAEFVKITNKAFGFTSSVPTENFTDVEKGQWFYDEVRIALKAGYITSKNATFRPNDPITREEVASIITSIKNNKDGKLDKLAKYKDANLVSEWAKTSVEGAIEQGYMGQNSTMFNPKKNITRAEAVTTLYRVVK